MSFSATIWTIRPLYPTQYWVLAPAYGVWNQLIVLDIAPFILWMKIVVMDRVQVRCV